MGNKQQSNEILLDPECEKYKAEGSDKKFTCILESYTDQYSLDPKVRNKNIDILIRNLERRLTCNDYSEIIKTPFPQCADVLLAQSSKFESSSENSEGLKQIFCEYFRHGKNNIFDLNEKSEDLEIEIEGNEELELIDSDCVQSKINESTFYLPSPNCIPCSCIKLTGVRNLPSDTTRRIKKLFVGDLVWLFYMERMGIFKMIGALLDDFAIKGNYPIANNDITAIIIETMVRLTKTGHASSVRDRDSTYRRCLGWTSDLGRKIGSQAIINNGFNPLFHKFIRSALGYYQDKRLATAIKSTTTGTPSVATLIEIGDTLIVLKNTFESFYYGRNYYNTLNGIVWAVAGLDLIKNLRNEIGIPNTYKEPHQYVPEAYEILIGKKERKSMSEKDWTTKSKDVNRYTLHRECAVDSRDILLDIEALDPTSPTFSNPGGELEIWLDYVEARIEGYRTDYRNLTGIDLLKPDSEKIIEQRV